MAKTHLSLNVSDVEKSVAFYEAFFGVPAHKRRPGYANFDLSSPALKLALQENPPCCGGTLNHLGIQVATLDQVQGARDRLKAAGLASFDERDTTCCYARQEKVWVQDPDGNKWEVYVITDDLLDEADEEESDLSTPELSSAVTQCCV
ncbi:MAG: VOC family protein [Armatimonadetes bacterium]|nr:VOC family protein [Armatimonadota bacterium]